MARPAGGAKGLPAKGFHRPWERYAFLAGRRQPAKRQAAGLEVSVHGESFLKWDLLPFLLAFEENCLGSFAASSPPR